MPHRQSSGNQRTVSASAILSAIASDLSQIKAEDHLTYADLGRIFGKSEDQAAKYCDGTAEMGVTAFYFAKREWNGRFTGAADLLIQRDRGHTPDRCKATAITKALMELSLALEDDDEATPSEIRSMRKTLETARDALNELLGKLSVRAA